MDTPRILDTLIKRSATIKGSPDLQKTTTPIQLVDLISDLLENVTKLSLLDWELQIVDRLRHEVDHYSWVGIYWVKGEHLYLGGWSGPEATEHVKIPVGEGICGLAVRTKETVVVDDVNARSDYLACFPNTRSEIVVPIFLDGEAIGEIDIDGDTPDVYTDEDREQLERLASAISSRLRAS
jgi:L-methionine (R)-S-oxide reductase